MRKNKVQDVQKEFSILTVDDDQTMTVTLQAYFQSTGYHVDTENDPVKAIDRVREGHYDILLLDFLMNPICGDVVVEEIRKFNTDIMIILLTGHRSLAPPIRTIRELDIQGYYEKSDRFDQLELLVEACVKSIRQMKTIVGYRDGLSSILDDMPTLYQFTSVQGILDAVLGHALALVEASEGFVFLDATLNAGEGQMKRFVSQQYYYTGMGAYAIEAGLDQDTYFNENNGEHARKLFEAVEAGQCFAAPLINERNEEYGVLYVKREADKINGTAQEKRQLFDVFAKQASSVLSNTFLEALIREKNRELEAANVALHDNFMGMIDAIRSMVDAKDIYTRGHSERVAHYAKLIAQRLDKSPKYVERIELAGLFHDIGKIGTADAILLKPDRLTQAEMEEIKKHSARGAQILSALSAFEGIPAIIKSHHERYDGKGYPDGLAKGDIPEQARIIALADSFDAMTSNRHYRSSIPLETALSEIEKGKGTQFDPDLADTFLEVLKDFESIREELRHTYPPERDAHTV